MEHECRPMLKENYMIKSNELTLHLTDRCEEEASRISFYTGFTLNCLISVIHLKSVSDVILIINRPGLAFVFTPGLFNAEIGSSSSKAKPVWVIRGGAESAPDSLKENQSFVSCWVSGGFINSLKRFLWQILNYLSPLVNSSHVIQSVAPSFVLEIVSLSQQLHDSRSAA